MKWFKKNWKYLLIVPIVLISLLWVVRTIISIISSRTGGPDLSDLERAYKTESDRIRDNEIEVTRKIAQERDEQWRKIDAGESSPADVFNDELKGDRHETDA